MKVLVAGGGFAGVEALLALRELAGDRVELELCLGERRARSTGRTRCASRSGSGTSSSVPLAPLCDERWRGRCGSAASPPSTSRASTRRHRRGRRARATTSCSSRPAPAGSRPSPVRWPSTAPAASSSCDGCSSARPAGDGRGSRSSCPTAWSGALPLYELALLTEAHLRDRRRRPTRRRHAGGASRSVCSALAAVRASARAGRARHRAPLARGAAPPARRRRRRAARRRRPASAWSRRDRRWVHPGGRATASSTGRRPSTRRATPPTTRSSRAASRRSRRSRRRAHRRPRRRARTDRVRSRQSCAHCSSPARSRCTCAAAPTPRRRREPLWPAAGQGHRRPPVALARPRGRARRRGRRALELALDAGRRGGRQTGTPAPPSSGWRQRRRSPASCRPAYEEKRRSLDARRARHTPRATLSASIAALPATVPARAPRHVRAPNACGTSSTAMRASIAPAANANDSASSPVICSTSR